MFCSVSRTAIPPATRNIALIATTKPAAATSLAHQRSCHSVANATALNNGSRKRTLLLSQNRRIHPSFRRRRINEESSSQHIGLFRQRRRWHTTQSSNNGSDKKGSSGGSDSLLRTAASSFGIGSVAGVGGALAGMGGGFIMIPLMTSPLLLRLSQHQAHGTSLFAVMATGFAGAVSYGDKVQLESAAAVALCGMLSARLGAKATSYMSEKVLKRALGVLMLTMAPAVPLKAYVIEKYSTKSSSSTKTIQSATGDQQENDATIHKSGGGGDSAFQRFVVPGCIGLGSGFLAGVFGVGGGVIVVPALAVATSMDHYQALATSLAAMTPPAAVGTYTHYVAGNVALRVAPPLALGAFCGAYVGGKIGKKTDETTLRWGFTGLLTILGLQTLLKAF